MCRCELWARGLIATAPLINDVDNEPNLEPSLFTNISFVKCFEPPARALSPRLLLLMLLSPCMCICRVIAVCSAA